MIPIMAITGLSILAAIGYAIYLKGKRVVIIWRERSHG